MKTIRMTDNLFLLKDKLPEKAYSEEDKLKLNMGIKEYNSN
jgi:hypothetical protein